MSKKNTLPPIKQTSYKGVNLGVRDSGEGIPFVVISGWGYGACMGEALFGSLRDKNIRLITFDLPGTGDLKDKSSFVYIPRIATAVANYLRENNVNEATVLGHSFGSMVAQELALSDDDIVARLVLVSPYAGIGSVVPDLNASMDTLNRLMIGDRGLMSFLFPTAFLDHLKDLLGNVFEDLDKPASSKALSGQVWAASRWSTLGRLHNIYQPTFIAQGEKDPLNTASSAKALHHQIDKAELHTYPCGYLPFLECPDEAFRDLSKFIDMKLT